MHAYALTMERSFTVPMLWDKQKEAIVSNESSEIIRMFNSAFNEFLPKEKAELDLYPEPLRSEIDEMNTWVYDTVNSKDFCKAKRLARLISS